MVVLKIVSKESRVKVVVEIEIPEGDDEGIYREEFRRELARRILNIVLDRETTSAREAIEEVIREKERRESIASESCSILRYSKSRELTEARIEASARHDLKHLPGGR